MFKTSDSQRHHPYLVTLGGFHREDLAEPYRENRSKGRRAQWEPFSNLALALLAQAFEDAIGRSPNHNRTPGAIIRDREDSIQFLRSMSGDNYQDRLTWLEIAHPGSNAFEMDRMLQARFDKWGLPRL